MRYFSLLIIFVIVGCSNTLESTEVAYNDEKKYVIKVVKFEKGLNVITDIFINNEAVLRIDPKGVMMGDECRKSSANGTTIKCTYSSSYDGKSLNVIQVLKTSLLSNSLNYEIYLNGELLEVVNLRNR